MCRAGTSHHHHDHEHSHHDHTHHADDNRDYLEAVAAYKKSFATAAQVKQETPDPAVRQMLDVMAKSGHETSFDRFDMQKPHCSFGVAGTCCKNCVMGPCKITPKAPRGVCGADADLIVARNLLRSLAAGVASHGARGREVMLALRAAGRGELPVSIAGEGKLRKTAAVLGLVSEGKSVETLAEEIADILLADLSRTVPGDHKTLSSFATAERIARWKELDILPISAMHEVFEALHRTATGTDGDPENVLIQFLRCGLAFAWSSVLGSAIAMDGLYGLPVRSTVKVNLGAIREGTVNIAVHGHSPVLVSEIVRVARTPEFLAEAKAAGAETIELYGICCSGLSAMYRYGGVIPLANALGAELVLATGGLDLWVADVQDVFPTIMNLAECFKTVVVTTSDSGRLPGSEFMGFDHHHSNLADATTLAEKIVRRAITAFTVRREVPRTIPPFETEAMIGFSVEGITEQFGSLAPIAEALKSGQIKGVVNLVGCSNPRVVYEKSVLDVAERLIANDVLVLTNGCASFPLLKTGLCSPDAIEKAGDGLKSFLTEKGLPPIWHMGECLDNARASGLFRALADVAGKPISAMPFAFISPEWSNEKGIGAALGFRLLGINSYHSVFPPVFGSKLVEDFLYRKTEELIGSVMVVELDSEKLSQRIIADLNHKSAAI